jgi:outer membrane protein OmpA-like peptidoglycan-associated protein
MMKYFLFLAFLFSGACFAQTSLEFSDAQPGSATGWKTGAFKYGTAKPEGGKMVLTNNSKFMFWYETPYHFYLDSSAYFEVDFAITKMEGSYGNGLYFHVGNFDYEFFITPSGSYMFRIWNSNEKEDSASSYISSSAIRKTLGATNTLGVECHAGDITCSVNGEKIESFCNGKKLSSNPKKYTSASPFYRQRTSIFRISMSVTPGATMEVYRFASSVKPKTRHINLIDNPNQGLKKENLGPMVNSACEELNPVVSADDKQIYFSIRECNVTGTNSRTDDDIFYSTRDSGGGWTKFRKLGKPFNNDENSSMISISGDNNTIYYKGYYSGKKAKSWFAQRMSEGIWGPPQPFTVDEYKELNRYNGRTISTNRKIMIAYLEEANSVGNTDLYVGFSDDGITFTKPKNMGSTINTPLSEFGVYLAPDNKTLYFSSYGHPGYGSSDVFVSRRLDDTWTKWSKPENLGPEINTSEWDAYFSIIASGKYAYMVSTKNGTGGSSDIVRIPLPQSAKPDPVVLIKGRVLDAKTKKPLYAEVVSTLLKTNTKALVGHSDSATGAYQVIIPAGDLYDFLATKSGYFPNSQAIDLTQTGDYLEIVKDIYLQPVDSPGTVHLNNIYFKDCSDSLLPESNAELQRLAKFMHQNKGYDADIDLLMDKGGECPDIETLNEKRAIAIKKFLVKDGVEEKRLKHKQKNKKTEIVTAEPVKKDSVMAQYHTLTPKTETKPVTDPGLVTPQQTHIAVRFVRNKSHKHYSVRRTL